MKIEKIEVENFKCFEKLSLDLDNFNVIIGKNASGKSNIINIIKFIKDMLSFGIDQAIDLQGGINYLYNSEIKSTSPIKINFVMNTNDLDTYKIMNLIYALEDESLMLRKYEISLAIQPNKRGEGYRILQNSVKIYYDLLVLKEEYKKRENYDLMYELNNYKKTGEIIQECCESDGEITENFKGDYTEENIKRLKIQKELFLSRAKFIKGENLLLIAYLPISYMFQLTGGEKIKIYDFNPKILKSASFINKQNILEEDGSNIANVIQRILKNSDEKRRFLLVLKKLMPFIEDISTEKSFNKSMYFRVIENNQNNLPSALLSDGTVNIIALIVALFFEKNNDVVIIEEPEKNVHPKLTNQLVTLMKDVSNKKQIIITTHNTQLLASVQLKDIIYVYRNKKRFSTIERPSENNQVKEFIKNDLEIGDLFYEGLFTDKEG